jgi:CMP-N,N'-diacetyllegionaminic acid synthase
MIDGRRVIAVIAARGGSKGLPRKNILPLGGKPLIAWSIEAAAQSRYLDRAVVSTDDPEIAEAARAFGGDVPFMRPAELATDEAPIVDAVLHAVDSIEESYDDVVLLQASSPLRRAFDIDGAIELYRRKGAATCVSVTAVSKGPWWMYRTDRDGYLQPFIERSGTHRRQELPSLVMPNGAVYVAGLDYLRHTRTFYGDRAAAYEMPPDLSPDIDSELDLRVAEALLSRPRSV